MSSVDSGKKGQVVKKSKNKLVFNACPLKKEYPAVVTAVWFVRFVSTPLDGNLEEGLG